MSQTKTIIIDNKHPLYPLLVLAWRFFLLTLLACFCLMVYGAYKLFQLVFV